MLEHGGRLRAASLRYSIAREAWLDLSTGISPCSWLAEKPVTLSGSVWRSLPEDDDDLAAAAQAFYGAAALPVAGSQAAIQALPRLRAPCRVGVIAPSYNEHLVCWQRAGHTVISLTPAQCADAIGSLDVLLLVHPNNPSGQCYDKTTLRQWHAQLAARGGWLVLDEAFMDATPEHSLADESHREGLIVLRSLGKFFGLAGARVGFVLAQPELRAALAELLGPWPIAGPARQLAALALRDTPWQAQQRQDLHIASARLALMLEDAGLKPDGGCALFHWLQHPQAEVLHQALAELGILTRLFSEPASVRFGLPATAADWLRLQLALHTAATVMPTKAAMTMLARPLR